jgi:hypothetical protein
MADDIVPKLCPTHFTGGTCEPEKCPYIHLTDFQLTKSNLLELKDLFYLRDISEAGTAKVKFSDYELQLLAAPQPVFCWVCNDPIHPEIDYYFPCCDVFYCVACADGWRFPGHCPRCGRQDGLAQAPPEKIEEVSQKNAAILVPEIVASLAV